jgi:uncharacterized protein YebE (UPF0316 family)
MLKYFIIFAAGVVETYIYTATLIAATRMKYIGSSILMFLYMMVYLFILDTAFKDSNSKLMILVYAVSCGVGNFIRVYQDYKAAQKTGTKVAVNRKKDNNCRLYIESRQCRDCIADCKIRVNDFLSGERINGKN